MYETLIVHRGSSPSFLTSGIFRVCVSCVSLDDKTKDCLHRGIQDFEQEHFSVMASAI